MLITLLIINYVDYIFSRDDWDDSEHQRRNPLVHRAINLNVSGQLSLSEEDVYFYRYKFTYQFLS